MNQGLLNFTLHILLHSNIATSPNMPEGSASQPMVEASAPTTTPLAGETLLLAADHYDAHAHKVLEGIAVVSGTDAAR